jgi:hypothetical protein
MNFFHPGGMVLNVWSGAGLALSENLCGGCMRAGALQPCPPDAPVQTKTCLPAARPDTAACGLRPFAG